MTDTMKTEHSNANAASLREQLRSVPHDAVLRIDTPNPLSFDTRSVPIGRLCHEAAAALDSQAAQAQPSGWPAEFREILDWRMCSDPWPGGDMTVIDEWLDAKSRELGYSDWIDACHTLQRLPASPSHSKEPGDGDGVPVVSPDAQQVGNADVGKSTP